MPTSSAKSEQSKHPRLFIIRNPSATRQSVDVIEPFSSSLEKLPMGLPVSKPAEVKLTNKAIPIRSSKTIISISEVKDDEDIGTSDHNDKVGSAIERAKTDSAFSPATGKPKSLDGLTFLMIGELSGFTHEGFGDVLRSHGGTPTKKLSMRPDYVITGSDVRPIEYKRVMERDIHMVSQKEVYDMIKTGIKWTPENAVNPDQKNRVRYAVHRAAQAQAQAGPRVRAVVVVVATAVGRRCSGI